jgi:hypothetical protein
MYTGAMLSRLEAVNRRIGILALDDIEKPAAPRRIEVLQNPARRCVWRSSS